MAWELPGGDGWVEVIDPQGEPIGYLRGVEAALLGLDVYESQEPAKWESDAYLLRHFDLAHDAGILRGDMNDVQLVALQSRLLRDARRRGREADARFEEMLLAQNPELWQRIQEEKRDEERRRREDAAMEWRAPESPEELMADLQALGEDDEVMGGELGRDPAPGEAGGGWADGFLSPEDLEQMGD